MKKKPKMTRKFLKSLLRPMFCNTIQFGYATPKQVEEMLNKIVKGSPLVS